MTSNISTSTVSSPLAQQVRLEQSAVLVDSGMRRHIFAFLTLQDLDQCKVTRRLNQLVTTDQSFLAAQKIPKYVLRILDVSRATLQGVQILRTPDPQYQDFRVGPFGLRRRKDGETAVYFKVECRAEGNWRGSTVVKRSVGRVESFGEMPYVYLGVPGEGFVDCEQALQLLTTGASVAFDGTLPHRTLLVRGLILLGGIGDLSLEEDRPLGRCGCPARLIRKLFFSSTKFQLSLGK